jgi:hypothetical protein
MADEMQDSQKEALKNNELPQGELTQSIPVHEHAEENEQVHDKLAEFGETDLEHFVTKVSSSRVYARQVIRKMLGLDTDKPFINPETHTVNQAGNVVGQLDHSTYPPKVIGTADGTKSL